jgi:hypothetical protein
LGVGAAIGLMALAGCSGEHEKAGPKADSMTLTVRLRSAPVTTEPLPTDIGLGMLVETQRVKAVCYQDSARPGRINDSVRIINPDKTDHEKYGYTPVASSDGPVFTRTAEAIQNNLKACKPSHLRLTIEQPVALVSVAEGGSGTNVVLNKGDKVTALCYYHVRGIPPKGEEHSNDYVRVQFHASKPYRKGTGIGYMPVERISGKHSVRDTFVEYPEWIEAHLSNCPPTPPK